MGASIGAGTLFALRKEERSLVVSCCDVREQLTSLLAYVVCLLFVRFSSETVYVLGNNRVHLGTHLQVKMASSGNGAGPSNARSELVEGEGDAWPTETGRFLPMARKVDLIIEELEVEFRILRELREAMEGERGRGDSRDLLARQMEGLKEELLRLRQKKATIARLALTKARYAWERATWAGDDPYWVARPVGEHDQESAIGRAYKSLEDAMGVHEQQLELSRTEWDLGFVELEIGRLQDLYVAHANWDETTEEKRMRRQYERDVGGASTEDLLRVISDRIQLLETRAVDLGRRRRGFLRREDLMGRAPGGGATSGPVPVRDGAADTESGGAVEVRGLPEGEDYVGMPPLVPSRWSRWRPDVVDDDSDSSVGAERSASRPDTIDVTSVEDVYERETYRSGTVDLASSESTWELTTSSLRLFLQQAFEDDRRRNGQQGTGGRREDDEEL